MPIVHHHLIFQANVGRVDLGAQAENELRQFLFDLVDVCGMNVLIPPQLKFSHQQAWTGLVGIVTSHISFHYWTIENYIQLDIYSCKEFDLAGVTSFLKNFWKTSEEKILFINREVGKDFVIEKLDS